MLSKFSVKKPFTIIVAIIIIGVLGVVSYQNMTTDLMPSMNIPYAMISTNYIGASPEEVEEIVSKPLEQGLSSISNMKNIQSISSENNSMVMIELSDKANMDTAMIEIREKLDMLSSYFPDEVSNSTIMKLNPNMMPIMAAAVAVDGQTMAEATSFMEQKLLPEVESIEGIATVSTSGLVENLVNLEIDNVKIDKINADIKTAIIKKQTDGLEAELKKQAAAMNVPYDTFVTMLKAQGKYPKLPEIAEKDIPKITVTNEMIEGILKGQNFSMPTGSLQDGNISYLVKTGDKIKNLDELENLLIMSLPIDGFESIKLTDIAKVNMLDTRNEFYAKINGDDAVLLTFSKQADYSTAEVTKSIEKRFSDLEKKYDDIHFSTLMNQGEYVTILVDSIFKNIIVGAVLAAIILFIFLKSLRSTLVISVSIVISVVTAYVAMYFSGITLNIISMGGLALGVGMLVDNSIVVIENIYRLRALGMDTKKAAIKGAKQVSGAIFASTLTTIIVFVPVLFTHGFTKQIFLDMGLTIAFALLASLVVALTFVPIASATVLKNRPIKENRTFDKVKNSYAKLLDKTLNHKWIVYVIVIALLGGSLFSASTLGSELMPETDMGSFMVNVEMPDETKQDEAYKKLDETYDIIKEIEGVKTVGAMYGGNSGGETASIMGGGSGATIYVLLEEKRDVSTEQIAQQIRDKTENIDYELTVNASGIDMSALTGGEVVIDISAKELEELHTTANQVAEKISGIDGIIEIDNGVGDQSDEIRITVDKDKAMKNGLTVAQVFQKANEILKSGGVATTVPDNNIDYDIYVNKNGSKATIETLNNTLIETPMGKSVKLSEIATVNKAKGFLAITRVNSERTVSVTASVKDGFNIGNVNKEVQKLIDKTTFSDQATVKLAGQNELINSTFKDLYLMLGLAILFIYLVMVAQFQSLLSPFIVMFTIPLAFTGGLFAQFITGTPISAVSLIGMVLLVGIVVNNGIVFVDYTNQLVKEGMTTRKALVTAGRDRLRPIILTALTTIFAQFALCFDSSSAASMTKAMAITSIGGLLYATLLTLFLVPCLYEMFHKKSKRKIKKELAQGK